MSAYVIVSYDIADPDAHQGYVPGVLPLLAKHGAEVLVADFGADQPEGKRRGANVVLRFESDETAAAWYNDPKYQPLRGIRHATCRNNYLALAKALAPPGA